MIGVCRVMLLRADSRPSASVALMGHSLLVADVLVAFRKKLSRDRFLSVIDAQPRGLVAMEACGTAHGWGREIEKPGHEVRRLPPV